ncbi:hypothetical protein FQZ97_514040 [compost metagenome]
MLDSTNLNFQNWFKYGYGQALELARRAESEDQAWAALNFYTTGFKDGHLKVWRNHQDINRLQWAGWVVQYRNGKYLVTSRASDWPVDVPQIGDELRSCDGQEIHDLLVTKVAPFVDRRINLENTLNDLALHLTLGQPRDALWEPLRMKQCEIRAVTGEVRQVSLKWQPQPNDLSIFHSVAPRQSVKQLRPGIYWIHASNFMLKDEEGASFEKLLDRVRDLESAEAVVIDTRGNNGGNSLVGTRILYALMKDAFPKNFESSAAAYWRVSSLARKTLETHRVAARRMEGAESFGYKFVDGLLTSMNAAALRGDSMVKQDSMSLDADQELVEGGAPFRGKLVLVTDSNCGSACLNFVEEVLSIPGAIHVGSTTSTDTRYTDVAIVSLPSAATLWVPLKVWKGRKRGDNVPYVPQFRFEGDLNDTAAVQAWVLDSILPTAKKISFQ